MDKAAHQTLINDIENLLSNQAGIEETEAKKLRKSAESILKAQQSHPLKQNLTEQLEKLRARVHGQIDKREKELEIVMAELAKANTAIQKERLKEAEDATQKALSIAGQIPGLSTQRRALIDKQLESIYPKMRKLNAWRHWGTTQARENLIAQIKQLANSRLEPNQIVKTLRDAKAQWSDWEKSDHSEHKLWKEFSTACDVAYAPCKVAFKAQKNERMGNRDKKRELIADINTHYEQTDWQKPAWKEIDKWLRQIRGQYFKIGHTDYKYHKKLKVDFETAVDQFETHLSRERDRSLKMRQKLIEDVNALAQLDNSRDAMTQLTQLKKQWLVTVLGKRGAENKLWDQFQKAQDALYTKRNAEHKEQDQQRNENLKQKRLVVESLINAASDSNEALLAGQSVLAQHKDNFNDIGYVPRNAEKALMNSWRKAQKDFNDALKGAQKTKAKDAQRTLIDKSKFCATLEQKYQLGEAIDADTEQKKYMALPSLSKEMEAALSARFKLALSGKTDSIEKNTRTQLDRCMKLEVMLDLPTPDKYAKDKMAFQIERLSASMKKESQGVETTDSLKIQLLTEGALDKDESKDIWVRIDAILAL